MNEAAGQRRIRMWSAGCSTGEEAYTMAILLSRSLPDRPCWSIEILGTDISPAAIATAGRAVYTENSFRGVPPDVKTQCFEHVDTGRYRPRADLRKMVRFQELNLLDASAMERMRNFDVIFCRNVLIYFDASAAQRVVAHFHDSLRPGGYLFLGHAENLHGKSPDFASLHTCGTFIYTSVPRPPCHFSQGAGLDSFNRAPEEAAALNRESQIAVEQQPLAGSASAENSLPAGAWLGSNGEGSCQPAAPAAPIQQGAGRNSDQDPVALTPAASEAPALETMYERAIAHLFAEENVQAQRTFDEILRREPNHPASLLGKAMLLAGSGDSEGALGCCRRVLDADPVSAETYCVMSLLHEGLGDDRLGQRELEKAIYLDSEFSIAHFRLACLHTRAGRRDDAKREFRNTVDVLPDDDEQRVRLYSGGFGKETVAQLCEQQLGIGTQVDPSFNRKPAPTAGWSACAFRPNDVNSPRSAGASGFGLDDPGTVVDAESEGIRP